MSVVLLIALMIVLTHRLRYPAWLSYPAMLVVFCLSLPHPRTARIPDYARSLGASGLFLAIVVTLLTAGALSLGRRRAGLRGMLIGALAIVAIALASFEFHLSLALGLARTIEPIGTLGDTYAGLLIITLLQAALWLVGIHGPALLAAVVTPIYLQMQLENTAAFAQGHALPHLVVVSTFLFVFPGGCGATLGLAILLLRARSTRLKKLGYAVIAPSIINTNEPLILGLPIVFNPYLAVPFLFAPAVLVTTTYVAMRLGAVRVPISYVPSSVPTIVSVFLSTLDWRAVILAVLNISLSIAIYAPFVRLYDRAELARSA
jgi:PTS system cellobiose-specific IIC component